MQKRYLIHVAGYNLGLLMRLLIGAGTPREFIAMVSAQFLAVLQPDGSFIVMIFLAADNQCAIRRHDQTNPTRLNTQFLNGLIGDDWLTAEHRLSTMTPVFADEGLASISHTREVHRG